MDSDARLGGKADQSRPMTKATDRAGETRFAKERGILTRAQYRVHEARAMSPCPRCGEVATIRCGGSSRPDDIALPCRWVRYDRILTDEEIASLRRNSWALGTGSEVVRRLLLTMDYRAMIAAKDRG